MKSTKLLTLLVLAIFSCLPLSAVAGCGAAFCSLSTDRVAQGAWTGPGGRFDLRYEFIDQDQPRTGTRNVGVGEVPGHHDEIRTINRNWIAGFDYTFDDHWGISVQMPLVDRSHSHIHNHHGAQLFNAWNFTESGDARVVGRYRVTAASPDAAAFGLQVGLKLPTGNHKLENDEGDAAERSLQPGTGTTDAIVGLFHSGRFGDETSWFADASWTAALDKRENYKLGDRGAVNVGIAWPWTQRIALLIQLNTHWKDRDAGSAAEPDNTGGTFVHASPGISVKLTDKTQIYSFVQLPLYQHVNGVQLVADWAFVAGVSQAF